METSSSEVYVKPFEEEKKCWAKLRELSIEARQRLEASYPDSFKWYPKRFLRGGHSRDYPEFDFLLIDSPHQSLYLIDEPWITKEPGSNKYVVNQSARDKSYDDLVKSSTDGAGDSHEVGVAPAVVSKGGDGSDLDKSTVNGAGKVAGHSEEVGLVLAAEVVKDGVGSVLENEAGEGAGHSQEMGLVAEVVGVGGVVAEVVEVGGVSGLTTSKVPHKVLVAEDVEVGGVSELDKCKENGVVKVAGHTQGMGLVAEVVEVLNNGSSGSDLDWETKRIAVSRAKIGASSGKMTPLRKRKDDSDCESDFKERKKRGSRSKKTRSGSDLKEEGSSMSFKRKSVSDVDDEVNGSSGKKKTRRDGSSGEVDERHYSRKEKKRSISRRDRGYSVASEASKRLLRRH